ncbi:MAG: M16 family metallopeptidase [Nanoarchaeota archaeon]
MHKNFQKKILNNGITVLFEKRDLPVVSVGFGFKYGSMYESLNEKGIAHFIEHMIFKGTSNLSSEQISKLIEKNGGVFNAFTCENLTFYHFKIPSDQIKTGLNVFLDILKNPLFSQDEIEKERNIIFEEIKLHQDNPLNHVFHEIQKCLYNGTLEIGTLGTKKSVGSLNKKELFKRFEEAYTPDNMILCVVGDADFNEIVEFAEKNFSKKENNISKKEFSEINKEKTEKRKGLEQTNIVFAYHVPKANEKNSYASKLLNTITAHGMSSRLFIEIREKRNLAYAIKGGNETNKDFAYNLIYIGTIKEKINEVKKIILNEFKDISENLSQKELDEAKKQLIGNYKISLEDSDDQMVNLLLEEINGNAENFYDFEKNINNVKLEEIKNLAKKASEKYSFFVLEPED